MKSKFQVRRPLRCKEGELLMEELGGGGGESTVSTKRKTVRVKLEWPELEIEEEGGWKNYSATLQQGIVRTRRDVDEEAVRQEGCAQLGLSFLSRIICLRLRLRRKCRRGNWSSLHVCGGEGRQEEGRRAIEDRGKRNRGSEELMDGPASRYECDEWSSLMRKHAVHHDLDNGFLVSQTVRCWERCGVRGLTELLR
eukprot:759355-Hanusia_phi.AAC.2